MKAALTMTLPDLASLLARVTDATRRKRDNGQDHGRNDGHEDRPATTETRR